MSKKIQLSIKVDDSSSYLPDWGVVQAIREVVQNAKDAESEFNAPMKIEWYKGSTGRETLRITNEGCVIGKETLLFGHTTKLGNKSLIGKFGEGLKLALLVFAREKMNVRIFSGDEIWVPIIEKSEVFGANVLSVDIRPATYKNMVRVEIEGISKEDWDNYSKDYLFICKPKEEDIISVSSGSILKGDLYAGRIFVKGIFVERRDTLFGYNFNNAELDRDRKMVNYYSYEHNKSLLFDEALKLNKIEPDIVFGLLEIDSEDTRGYYFHTTLQDVSLDKIAASFIKKYGKKAVVVSNNSEAIEIGHLDPEAKPIVVPDTLSKLLSKKLGNFEGTKTFLMNQTKNIYDQESLDKDEILSLGWGVGSINMILSKLNFEQISLGSVTVCDFKNVNLLGQFCQQNGQIKLSRSVLKDRNLTLEVLIHEVAHSFGGDAEKSHVSKIEKFWSVLVGDLTKDMRF